MCVRVVPLSQASSRDLLYVKCVCVLSRYLRPVVEICYILNVCACCPVISGQLVEICYMLNVCACCPVISGQLVEICYMLNVRACCPVISGQ